MSAKRSRPAFTLIELLVVIAIIAILAAILFPVFSQAREKARQSNCTSNFRNVSMAVQQYLQDYDELFPLTRPAPWVTGHRYIVVPPEVLIDFPPPLMTGQHALLAGLIARSLTLVTTKFFFALLLPQWITSLTKPEVMWLILR
jgi:prepilin-type N-terminal cleavage/methylation domain-containing protein